MAIVVAVNSFTVTNTPQPVVTLRAVARRAGLSLATVSYALRAHPKIPPATRELVAAAALELGYRPNSRVAGLMAHIRGAGVWPRVERIAFVWVHTSRRVAAENPYLRAVFKGAVARAERLGFALEEFWTDDAGMKEPRLQEIIVARGIAGVLLSPVLTPVTSLALEWDWSQFAAVVIGNVTWTPELHHVGHHHFFAMRTVLLELVKLGYTRPAAVVDAVIDERAKHAWTGAFFARLQVATLRWSANLPANIGGIDQCDELLGAQAVELLIAQLHHNERGPPRHPGMMLFPGQWMAPAPAATAPQKNTRPRSRP